jgi:hypothetical protein
MTMLPSFRRHEDDHRENRGEQSAGASQALVLVQTYARKALCCITVEKTAARN